MNNSNESGPPARPRFDPHTLLNPKAARKQAANGNKAGPPVNAYGPSKLDGNDDFTDAVHGCPNAQRGQEQMRAGLGSMLEKMHNVERRQDLPPTKRQKIQPSETDEEDFVKAKKSEHQVRHGGGELGDYLKDQRKQAIERNPSTSNIVDLTAEESETQGDEEITVVKDNMTVEVCAGRIEGAKVNAHLVPTPKLNGLASNSVKIWAAMSVTLCRRPGLNTHIIGVRDQKGIDFGSIDARTASVLAPLMDKASVSKIRFKAVLDARPRAPHEFPGQTNPSAAYSITIVLYCPRRLVEGIGRMFSQRQVWLRNPLLVDRGIEVVNPHQPKDLGSKQQKKALATSSSRYSDGRYVMRSTEQVRQDVMRLFENLQNSNDLPEMDVPDHIITQMLPHQKQALWFLTDREKDKSNDAEVEDESSLWQEHDRGGRSTWYNVITGHEVQEKPKPVLGGILADVMGLGKTLNILALVVATKHAAQEFAKATPPRAKYDNESRELKFNSRATLVICPKSVISNWEEQIERHVKSPENNLKYRIYHGTNRPNDPEDLRNYDVVISTYSTITADADNRSANRPRQPLAEINWFRIVLDEAHSIREQRTRQSKATCALSAQRRWAVTGTPVQNRLEDLGALIKFLRIQPFDEPKFFTQYIISGFKTADIEILPKMRILVDSITLRRGKDKLNLPKRDEQFVRLSMPDGERQFYDFYAREATAGIRAMVDGKEKIAGRSYHHVLRVIQRLRLLCAGGPDLLSDDDWAASKGLTINNAIDLEDDSDEKQERTPRQAFEMWRLVKDANMNTCSKCSRTINSRDVIEDDSDSEEDSDDLIAYLAPCNQFICVKCVKAYKNDFEANAGPDGYGYCPLCETYMHRSLFELRQGQLDADEAAMRRICKNPKLAEQAGRYSGPHTKTLALISALKEDAAWSSEHPNERPVKSVVFSFWTNNLDLIQIGLMNANIDFVRLDGKMSLRARKEVLERFSHDDNVCVFLISISAGGLGLNLTTASRVYVMEPQYNPAQEQQAIERVHRLGQERAVIINRYIMEDSFEDKMLVLQQRKLKLANMSMDRGLKFDTTKHEAAKQRMEDLKALFR